MGSVLFLTWNGGGNLPPGFGVAQELRSRGHDVLFAGQELRDLEPRPGFQENQSLESRCLTRDFPFTLLERSSQMWERQPPNPGRIVTAMMACKEHLDETRQLIQQAPTDVVMVDCLMFGALAAVEQMGIRCAVLVHSPPGLIMAPGGGMEGFLLGPVNDLRTEAGLPGVGRLWDCWAPFRAVCMTITELDPLAPQVPSSFKYTGPVFDEGSGGQWVSPWSSDDPRPLVLVSFASSAAWDQTSRIQRTLDGLEGTDYRVLVTTSLADATKLTVPENAVAVESAPHQQVLPHASAMVNHAGHGSVAMPLSYGVPVVCLPNPVADQPPIAKHVERLGAGLALDGESATPGQIRHAIDSVVNDQSFTDAAQRIGNKIKAANGASAAASSLEELFGDY